MPCKQVDRAALAEFGERYLRLDLPPIPRETGRDDFDQRGVASVEKTIDVTAAPTDRHDDLGVEHGEQASKPPQRDSVELAAFDQRDESLAEAGDRAGIDLPHPPSVAEEARDAPDDDVVHAAILTALTRPRPNWMYEIRLVVVLRQPGPR